MSNTLTRKTPPQGICAIVLGRHSMPKNSIENAVIDMKSAYSLFAMLFIVDLLADRCLNAVSEPFI